MNTRAYTRLSQAFLLTLGMLQGSPAAAQPVPGLPAIKGMAGVKVERVADGKLVQQPTLAFAEDGMLYVLERRPGATSTAADELLVPGSDFRYRWLRSSKDARDAIRTLHDTDGDGLYNEAKTLMEDLESASGLLVDRGWIYWTSRGCVLRRRPFDAELLERLQAEAEAKRGPPTQTTSDGKWLEQELVRGLAAVAPFEASHLTMGIDGSLYVACGSGTSMAQSWDGSSAAVVRSGAVFRMQPDGSAIAEHCRGLVSPIALAFDELGQLLVADRRAPVPGAGCRLIQALEGADYGWRHARPKGDSPEAYQAAIAKPDPLVADPAVPRPGTLPASGEHKDLSASGAALYLGASFPASLRGALLVGSAEGSELSILGLDRDGGLYRLTERQVLFGGDRFQPQQVVVGPDGAIYVAGSSNADGAVWRLSWGGSGEAPAIALRPLDAMKSVPEQSTAELLVSMESEDHGLRRAAAAELVGRATSGKEEATAIREQVLSIVADESRPAQVRAAAMFGASQIAGDSLAKSLFKPLADQNTHLQRLAGELLGRHPPTDKELLAEAAQHVQGALGQTRDPLVGRTLRITLGKLAAKGEPTSAEWSFEGTSVVFGPKLDPLVFDGHVRALELAPGAAKELMLGNLDVAINLPITDFAERQRIKEFVVATAEAMRTRELADFLDALMRGKDDFLAKMEAPLEARLIAAYQNVLVLPPIQADAVAQWIEEHPGGPPEVELAALETLSIVGTSKPEAIDKLAASLLARPDSAAAVAKSLLAGKTAARLAPQVLTSLKAHVAEAPSPELQQLHSEVEKKTRAP